MGRQRKKRCLKKIEEGEEGTYESESVLNSGVASTSSLTQSSSKLVSTNDVFRVEESAGSSGSLRTVLSSPRPSTSSAAASAAAADSSTDIQRIEPMEISNAEKEYSSSTTEVRMQHTTLKVHISRCIRRRTWPQNLKRQAESQEFNTSPEALLMTYGVNAYQFWARNKNKDITKGSKRYKEDILAVPLHQWNKVLSLFIQTVTDPNERTLSGGAILYMVLGLQLYIFTHNRSDNLLFDDSFNLFSRTLCELLAAREKAIQIGRSVSLIEEETLWQAEQLGAHSPAVLLMSILYLNTKYFKLKTVKSHANLRFKHISVLEMTNAAGKTSSALSFVPQVVIDLTDENKEEPEPKQDEILYDQLSIDESGRCPVTLYKFYRSKCPKNAKRRDDKVYLTPLKGCRPDSEYWYSAEPLPEIKIFRMLQYFRYVQEIK